MQKTLCIKKKLPVEKSKMVLLKEYLCNTFCKIYTFDSHFFLFHFTITLENNLVVQGILKIVSLDFSVLDKLLANVLTRISYLVFQCIFSPPMSYILDVASKTNDKTEHSHFGLTSVVIHFCNYCTYLFS